MAVDGGLALLAPGPVKLAAAIDGVVDLGVSLYRTTQIMNAADAAKKNLPCDQ